MNNLQLRCLGSQNQSVQYSFTQGAGQSSGLGFLAKHTIDDPQGRLSFASAKKSMTFLGYSCCIQSAFSMVISSQKSKRTINLVTESKLSLSAWQTGLSLSSCQIITELLYPSLWFFSQAKSPVRKVANSPLYAKSSSRLPVMIMSRSMQNLRPDMSTLNSVTFPHQRFHPSSSFSTLISGCSPFPSSVKQQKVTFQVVFFMMPAQSLLTQSALYLAPHLTVKMEICLSSSGGCWLSHFQGVILTGVKPEYSGLPFLRVYSIICYQECLMASSFLPSCRRISVKLISDSLSYGFSSKDLLQYSKPLSNWLSCTYMTAMFVCASMNALKELRCLENKATSFLAKA